MLKTSLWKIIRHTNINNEEKRRLIWFQVFLTNIYKLYEKISVQGNFLFNDNSYLFAQFYGNKYLYLMQKIVYSYIDSRIRD